MFACNADPSNSSLNLHLNKLFNSHRPCLWVQNVYEWVCHRTLVRDEEASSFGSPSSSASLIPSPSSALHSCPFDTNACSHAYAHASSNACSFSCWCCNSYDTPTGHDSYIDFRCQRLESLWIKSPASGSHQSICNQSIVSIQVFDTI